MPKIAQVPKQTNLAAVESFVYLEKFCLQIVDNSSTKCYTKIKLLKEKII